MMTTLMPNGASSWASPSDKPSNAHFDVTYGDWASAATRPAIEVMLTIAPLPRSRMPGSTAWMQRTAPHRLTFITSRYRSVGHSSATALPPTPALLTNTATGPVVAKILANPSATDSSDATSSSTNSTAAPRSSAIAFNLSALVTLRTVPYTS